MLGGRGGEKGGGEERVDRPRTLQMQEEGLRKGKGREFTFVRVFLTVKTNITAPPFRPLFCGGVGQRISSRFADYERDQAPDHSGAR